MKMSIDEYIEYRAHRKERDAIRRNIPSHKAKLHEYDGKE